MSFYECLSANPNKVLYDVEFKSVTAGTIIPAPTPYGDGILIENSGSVTSIPDGNTGDVLVTDGNNNPTWQPLPPLQSIPYVLSKGSSVYVSGVTNTNCFFGFGAKAIEGNNGLTPPAFTDAGSFISYNLITAPVSSLIVVPPNTTYSNCKIIMTSILNDCTQNNGQFEHRCELHEITTIDNNSGQFLGFDTNLLPVNVICTNLPQTFDTQVSSLFNIVNNTLQYKYFAVLWDLYGGLGSLGAVMHVSYELTVNN